MANELEARSKDVAENHGQLQQLQQRQDEQLQQLQQQQKQTLQRVQQEQQQLQHEQLQQLQHDSAQEREEWAHEATRERGETDNLKLQFAAVESNLQVERELVAELQGLVKVYMYKCTCIYACCHLSPSPSLFYDQSNYQSSCGRAQSLLVLS